MTRDAMAAPRPRHRYLLLIQQDGMPAESIVSASDDLAALEASITSVREARGPSRIAFRGLKRDATIAQIFDTEALQILGTFDSRLGFWRPSARPAVSPIAA